LEKGQLASTSGFRLVFGLASGMADRTVPRRPAFFLRKLRECGQLRAHEMNTQRVIRFAVGLWGILFAISFLSSIVVEIIRDRETKRRYRKQLVEQRLRLLQSWCVEACREPAVDRSEEIAEAELIECS
jgi:hypothetical protein